MRLNTALLGVLLVSVGCYQGFDIEEKEPPPGYPGGSCSVGACNQAVQCLAEEQICIDPMDPCKGIYCGGNGTCGLDLDTSMPFCTCDPGYTNASFAFFCTPGL
jgi:hypothetical protein